VAVIPTAAEPLLSVASLCDKGLAVKFRPPRGGFTVKEGREVLLKGAREGNRFALLAELDEEASGDNAALADDEEPMIETERKSSVENLTHKSEDKMGSSQADSCKTRDDAETERKAAETIRLMHERFCHRSSSALEALVRSGAVLGLPDAMSATSLMRRVLADCKVCAASKITRRPVSGTGDNDSVPFGTRITADIAGPFRLKRHKDGEKLKAIGEAKYFQVLREARGRVLHCDILRHKSDAPQKVKEFVALLERQTGVQVREFHSDGDPVYTGNELAGWLRRKGIEGTTTTRDTPEHNALPERTIRTVKEGMRATLHQSGMPHAFWPFAVKAVAHVLHRTLTGSASLRAKLSNEDKKDEFRTPQEFLEMQ
jgi:hypothetical protein